MAPLIRAVAALAAATLFTQVTATNVELPPCLDPFKPFAPAGCFADKGTKGENALDFRSTTDQYTMTTEKCVAECKGNGYRYAGLTYYGVCYCSQTINSPSVPEETCNYPCGGNKTEICGGPSAFTVWADPTFPDSSGVTVNSYQSIGCYSDDTNHGRTVAERQNQVDSATMTPSSCISACAGQGFAFAGVEYGGECYCGVVIGNYTQQIDMENCKKPCNGDSTKYCGGSSTVEIYAAKELLSLEPCGYVPPANSPSSSLPPVSSSVSVSSSTSVPVVSTSSQSPPDTLTTSSSTTVSTQSPPPNTPSTSTTVSTQGPPPASTTSTSTTVSTHAPPPPSTSMTVSTQAPPPGTTSQPLVTTKPPTTTLTTPTTTKPAMCSTTIVTPATCEYGCGSWCNKNLPDFDDSTTCQHSHNRCMLQVNACFKSAGWPGSQNCLDFKAWCKDVGSYCSNTCKGKGSCSKKDCFQKKVPKGYKPGTTSVSTFPCPSKSTSTSTPVTVVPPPPTGICKQPSSWIYNYGPGNPVGGIEIPVVTCNDILEDFKAGNQFKLYTESDSKSCKSYNRNNVPNACSAACLEQYNECQDVYAQGCKAYNNRRSGGSYSSAPDVAKRWFFSDNYNGAINKCTIQYKDCLSENKNALAANKCGTFGTNY